MSSFYKKEFTFDRVARIFFIAITIFIVGWMAYLIRDALIPFIIGWILAAILMPVVKFFQYKLKFKVRLIAILSTIILFLSIMTVLFLLFVPPMMAEFRKTGDLILKLEKDITSDVYTPPTVKHYIEKFIDFQEYKDKISSQEAFEYFKKYIPKVLDMASKAVMKIFNLISIVFIFLYAFFIMLYYEKLKAGFFSLLPDNWKGSVRQVIDDLTKSTERYFRGQSMVASLVGILFSIGFLIVGLPLAIPLGLFIGLLNMIPYAQFIGVFPTILLCALHAADTGIPFWKLIIFSLLVFTVVQITQDTILTPKIMGKVTGLNPAIILLCLSIGGTLFGVMGIIMALPLAPMILTYYHIYILKKPREEVLNELNFNGNNASHKDKKDNDSDL